MRWPVRLALLATLFLTGCSVLGIVYDNADRLALAYVDDWFDLDHAQGKRFRERVRERMAVHRQDELPRYVAFLKETRAMASATPSPAELERVFGRSRDLIELGIRRSLPLMADTLAELSPSQVEHLARQRAEANADELEELLEATPAERQREREQELIKEFERWTGRLDDAQRRRLRELVARIPDGARTWLEYREQRQQGLLELLRARAGREAFVAFAEEWWLGDRHLDPALAQQLESNRRVSAESLAGLVASLTPKQRDRVLARIDDLIEDIEDLRTAAPRRSAG